MGVQKSRVQLTPCSGGLSRLFLFQGDRYCRVRRKTHLLPFDARYQPQIYKMMVAFVASFAAVGLRKFDPAIFNAIDSSDINVVRSDHFHMLLYATVAHFISPR